MGKKIHLRAERCQKYALCQKFLQIKVGKDLIVMQKLLLGAYVYPPWRGTRELQGLPSLKYYDVQKWERRFTLGVSAAKNTHCQKIFQIKVY